MFFNETSTTYIYTYCHTLSLHDALPILRPAMSASSSMHSILISVESMSIANSLQLRNGTSSSRQATSIRRCPQNSRTSSRLSVSTRSKEHTSELQSLMRISYAVFCLKKKTIMYTKQKNNTNNKKH